MAHQIDSEFTGTIENLIFYERDGKYLIRTVPVQAAGSQRSAKAFGSAASNAKVLRHLLGPMIPWLKDKKMQYRLDAAMRLFLAPVTDRGVVVAEENSLSGFRFVPASSLKDCLKVPLSISRLPDGNISVEVAALNPLVSLAAPTGTNRAELQLMVVAFHPNNNESFAGVPVVWPILYTDGVLPAFHAVMPAETSAGSVVLLAASLTYWDPKKRIWEEGFQVAEILEGWRDVEDEG